MKSYLIALIIAVLLLVLQHFLSSREQVWLGAIIPIIYVAIVGSLLIVGQLEVNSSRDAYFLGAGLLIFLGIWAEGRSSFKKKRKKELDKMKAFDIK